MVFAIMAPAVAFVGGGVGLMAAIAAAGLCLLGAVLALAVSHHFREGHSAMGLRFLVGMLPRMGVPLAGAVVFQFLIETLAKGGFLYYLLLFYPITLAMEALLQLPADNGSG
jgi:hypothetical protein